MSIFDTQIEILGLVLTLITISASIFIVFKIRILNNSKKSKLSVKGSHNTTNVDSGNISQTSTGDRAGISVINSGSGSVRVNDVDVTSNSIEPTDNSENDDAEYDKLSNRKQVKLSDLVNAETPVISYRKFSGVEILGPCAIYVSKSGGVEIGNCRWYGSYESSFIAVPDRWKSYTGAIGLEHCSFIDCVFKNVAIMAKTSEMEEIKKGFSLAS